MRNIYVVKQRGISDLCDAEQNAHNACERAPALYNCGRQLKMDVFKAPYSLPYVEVTKKYARVLCTLLCVLMLNTF